MLYERPGAIYLQKGSLAKSSHSWYLKSIPESWGQEDSMELLLMKQLTETKKIYDGYGYRFLGAHLSLVRFCFMIGTRLRTELYVK